MWNDRLERINTDKQRIESLELFTRPVYSAPYRTGSTTREFVKAGINKMQKENIIGPAQTDWVSPLVLATKKGGALKFCVDYYNFNVVTNRDSYATPRVDEHINS